MKKVGLIKRAFCILLIFLLSINSFAAVVSDNDGSAFITKAEFDSLKNNFQAQIDNYNSSIDSKIDGAIAGYLAGIKIDTKQVLGFEYEGKKLGDKNVNELVWTKNPGFALRSPNAVATTDLTVKDQILLNYEMVLWTNNSVYFLHGTYKRNEKLPNRYFYTDGYIDGWGEYNYKFNCIYFNPVQDKPQGEKTTTTLVKDEIFCYNTNEVYNYLKATGRNTKITHNENITINNGNLINQDSMSCHVFYIQETLQSQYPQNLIKFAPLSVGCEAMIKTDSTGINSWSSEQIWSRCNGSGSNYVRWDDSWFSTAPNSVTWATTCEQRTQGKEFKNTRTDREWTGLWFDNKTHNKMTYKGLVNISGAAADGPIEGGMLYAQNLDRAGEVQIITTSGTPGKIIFYLGTKPEATWGGKKATYATDETYTVKTGAANSQVLNVKKGDNIYVVWLPDTDCPLPSIEATLTIDD